MLRNRSLRRPFWPLLLVALLLAAGFSLTAGRPAEAQPRRNIVLLYFIATGQNNAVLLEWATASEFETAGFVIERALSVDGSYAVLDGIGFIPSEGSGIVGAEYEAVDTAASNGTTYWYRLVEVELDGSENREGPVSATPGNVQPTATYTSTPSPTATASPTQPSGNVSTPVPPANNQEPTATNPPTQPPAPQPPPTQPAGTTAAPANPATATAPPAPVSEEGQAGNPAPTAAIPTAGSLTNSSPVETPEASGEAISQVEPTATGGSSYPGPPTATTTPADEATAYPGVQPPEPGNALEATSYPGGSEINSPAVIGGQNSPAATQAAQATEGQRESGGTVFLWVAFAAALLIFVAGVLGSIFLFNRQRVRGG